MSYIQETFQKKVQRPSITGDELKGLCPVHPDTNASFSANIKTGLWKCFGCGAQGNFRQFCEKAKIQLPEKLVATYEYKDERGELLYVVERYETPDGEKTFKQKRWNAEKKEFESSLGDVRRVLYNLPALAVAPAGCPVFVTEGEKCAIKLADRLAAVKDPAVVVTAPGGANNWRPDYAKSLEGRDVIVLPDNDDPGRKHAARAVDSLRGVGRTVKLVELPGLAPKEDIYDWLEAGHTVEELWKLVEAAPYVVQEEVKVESMQDLLVEPWQPPNWLIENIWSHGRGFLVGEPGIGKTWVALSMAISVATGKPFLGVYEVKNPGPILFLQEEESRRNFRDKVGMLARGQGLAPIDFRGFHHITQQLVQLPRSLKALTKAVKERGCRAVFIDSFREVFTGDENNATEVKEILDALRALQNETGCSIVIIHHLNKPSKGNEHLPIFHRMRGSTALWAWRESIIGLSGADLEGSARAQFQFKDAPEQHPIEIKRTHAGERDQQTMVLEATLDQRGEDIKTRVLAIIEEENGELTVNDVKAKKGLSGSGKERGEAVQFLLKEGRIKKLVDRRLATADFTPKEDF